jgi:hypothetical protein
MENNIFLLSDFVYFIYHSPGFYLLRHGGIDGGSEQRSKRGLLLARAGAGAGGGGI